VAAWVVWTSKSSRSTLKRARRALHWSRAFLRFLRIDLDGNSAKGPCLPRRRRAGFLPTRYLCRRRAGRVDECRQDGLLLGLAPVTTAPAGNAGKVPQVELYRSRRAEDVAGPLRTTRDLHSRSRDCTIFPKSGIRRNLRGGAAACRRYAFCQQSDAAP